MTHIVDRIGEYALQANISIRKIEQKIGASNGIISKAIGKDKDIHSKWIALFAMHYPEVNPTWLLKGEGHMLKNEETEERQDILRDGESFYGYVDWGQHQEIINSLRKTIQVLENQLMDKERVIEMKDRLIRALEEKTADR